LRVFLQGYDELTLDWSAILAGLLLHLREEGDCLV
jgi:hypothetical protein